MKTSFKKIVAGASLLALVSMNALNTNAAAVTIDSVTRTNATDYVVTSANGFTAGANAACTVVFKDSENPANTHTFSGTDCTVTNDSTLSLTNSLVDFDNSYVTVTFSTKDDTLATSYGAGAFEIGTVVNGTQNKVNVSAVVLPILSMALSTSSLDFGELDPTTPTTVNLDVTTASNAAGGITVAMDSNGLRTGITASDYVIGNKISADSEVQTTGTDTYQFVSTTNADGTVVALTDVAATQNVLVADNVAKSNATTNVALTADIDNQTEAGNYGDTLTFTVTATF